MTQADLDHSYTSLCATLSEIGQDRALQFLSRFALLAMINAPNAEQLEHMIQEAAHGLLEQH